LNHDLIKIELDRTASREGAGTAKQDLLIDLPEHEIGSRWQTKPTRQDILSREAGYEG
jgi:hypothetical protein